MKIFALLSVVCGIALASTTVAASSTKEIALDYNIVPKWSDLGTTSKTKKIRLLRVYGYWTALEKRDKKAVKKLFKTKHEDKKAVERIDDYFDAAKTCLKKQKEYKRQSRKQVNRALKKIGECIHASTTPLVFSVDASVELPNEYFVPLCVEYGGADDEATAADTESDNEVDPEDADDADAATGAGTAAGTGTEGQADASLATQPAVETQPLYTATAVDLVQPIVPPVTGGAPNPYSWPLSPTSREVPPLWALDLDTNQSVDGKEWEAYVSRLHALAHETVVRGTDPVAVALLKQIVDFHYGALSTCITTKLKTDDTAVLRTPEFELTAQWIQQNCQVKFRYSFLAGAPPFEWVAKDKATVTGSEIAAWVSKKVDAAHNDLAKSATDSPHHKAMVERFGACALATFQAAGEAPVHRDVFYAALRQIEQCARD